MTLGKFITIEGTEGAGKSTALQFIQDYFTQANIDIIQTREPGGTEIAEQIRHVLLHAQTAEKILPETELLLMFAGRVQHIHHCIQPALAAGKWVISDRYVDASYAYQGGGRGMGRAPIELLDKWLVRSLYPDLTLLMDIPAELGLMRAENRGAQKDRIEQEKIDFFQRVRDTYLNRAKQDPARIKIIDASQSLQDVQVQIKKVLDDFISHRVYKS